METPAPSSPSGRGGNIAAGVKRPAPTLLPAFDFPSSPPKLPPAKRQARSPSSADEDARIKYPTPMPTSSLGFDISSSPPQLPSSRPNIPRTLSSVSVSERAPLSALPTLTPSSKGEPMLLGRSSVSCHHQLSSNRLISRVHVKVIYCPDPFNPRIEIVCVGWNGIKVHCQSHAWELAKGDTFSTTQEGAEILVDVQDARVAIAWPRVLGRMPARNLGMSPSRSKAGMVWGENDENMDPIRRRLGDSPFSRPGSFGKVPISPASSRSSGNPVLTSDFLHSENTIQVYEDRSDPSEEEAEEEIIAKKMAEEEHAFSLPEIPSRAASPCPTEADEEESSELDELSSSLFKEDDSFSPDSDAENDQENSQQAPAFSFLASSTSFHVPARGLKRSRSVSSRPSTPSTPLPTAAETEAVKNHATNQLAFSRLSSTPLSTILANLPPTITANPLSSSMLASILEGVECIGTVHRKGKDAAGKPLESQYYYVPDKDEDEARKGAVTEGLGKRGLRACRKVHKQYFWRKPKMPGSHH